MMRVALGLLKDWKTSNALSRYVHNGEVSEEWSYHSQFLCYLQHKGCDGMHSTTAVASGHQMIFPFHALIWGTADAELANNKPKLLALP